MQILFCCYCVWRFLLFYWFSWNLKEKNMVWEDFLSSGSVQRTPSRSTSEKANKVKKNRSFLDSFWYIFHEFQRSNIYEISCFLEIMFLMEKTFFLKTMFFLKEKHGFGRVGVDLGGPRNRPKPQKVRSGPSQNAIEKKREN